MCGLSATLRVCDAANGDNGGCAGPGRRGLRVWVRWRVDVAHGGRAGHRHDELGGRDRCDGGQLGDGRLLEVDVDIDELGGGASAGDGPGGRAAVR